MNIIRMTSVLAVCGGLFACGGSQKPSVEPSAAAQAQASAPTRLDTLVTDQDRYSYALGKDLGRAIAAVNVPLRMDLVKKAIDDQMDSTKKPLMSDSAAESALQDLLLRMQQQKESEEKAAAKKNLDEQAQFLAKNIMDSTVKTTPKGVQYKLVVGGTGISPKASDKVQVHYVGALLNGTEFDNSFKRGEPLEFPVSAVIEGWQDLLMVMKEGEKVKAWIPSALAYGEEGVPPMIPANSLLVFEVELLKVYAENPEADPAAAAPTAAPADNAAKPAAEPAKASKEAPAPAEKKPASKN